MDSYLSYLSFTKSAIFDFLSLSFHVLFPLSTNNTLTIKLGDFKVQTFRYKINYKDIWYNMENIANIYNP